MRSDWKECVLSEVLSEKGYIRGPFGSALRRNELLQSGIPVYEQQHAIYNHREFRFYISQDKFKEMERFSIRPDDLIISCSGTVGRVSIIGANDPVGIISQALLLLRVKRSIVLPDYLKYFFQSSKGYNSIVERSSGSVQVNIARRSIIEQIPILLPPISIQEKIVSILRSLDDKIELNNRINENLEQRAFAIFDKLMNAEPESAGPLSAIADLNPKRDLARNAFARCIDMACLSTIGSFPNGWEVKPYTGGMKFRNGDTLLARITPCLENGKTAFINFLDDGEVAFGSTEYIVICPKDDYPPEFFYCLVRYPAFIDYAVKNLNGSSGRQRVSAETIGKYEIPQPNRDALEYFVSVVPVLFKAIRNNSFENERLADMRDCLLPKLLSGELDVSSMDM